MTYFGVLAQFIVPPLAILALLIYFDRKRGRLMPPSLRTWPPLNVLFVLVIVAIVYTTPWDNYLVATGVWWYAPQLVTGLVLGWVPIEEYTFFVLQTLLTGLWFIVLAVRLPKVTVTNAHRQPEHFPNLPALRIISTTFVALLWLAAWALLFSGWPPGTYLALEATWALLPILLQCGLGGDILWQHRRLILWSLLPTTLYLCLVDALAISSGTWTIDPAQSLQIFVGSLPLEEIVFFLITNTLVVFGLTLVLARQSQTRVPAALVDWLSRWLDAPNKYRKRQARPAASS